MNNKEIEKLRKATDKVIQKAISNQIHFQNNPTRIVDIFVDGGSQLIPQYKTKGSSGLDVVANITDEIVLEPFERRIIPTGVFVDIPEDCEFQLRPRSSLALKRGLTFANAIGTIDSDYTKEIGAIVINLSPTQQTIKPNERIGQLVLVKVEKVEWNHVDSTESFDSKDRKGGYGSTGEF